MAVCEILSVGTEILLGDILNTNCRFLSVELAKLGITVLRHTTVGDNADRLAAALGTAGSIPAETSCDAHIHLECVKDGAYLDPEGLM